MIFFTNDKNKPTINQTLKESLPILKLLPFNVCSCIFLFTETVLFILLQIFVLIRLDGDTDWSWFEVCQL